MSLAGEISGSLLRQENAELRLLLAQLVALLVEAERRLAYLEALAAAVAGPPG